MRRCKKWTQEEIDYLMDHWGTGLNIKWLATRMHRTVEGVIKKARKLKLGAYLNAGESITYGEFARAFGIYQTFQWYKDKLIKAGLPVHYKQIHTKKVTMVNLEKFWKWAEKNREALDWSKLEINILGEEPKWVDEQRRMDYINKPNYTKKWTKAEHQSLIYYIEKGMTMEEIAQKLNRTESAIERRCYDYYLQRPRIAEKRKWTEEEIIEIVRLRSEGWNYRNIANKVGRSETSVRGKIYDVTRKRGTEWIASCKKKGAASSVAL
jgi:transposase-like protein